MKHHNSLCRALLIIGSLVMPTVWGIETVNPDLTSDADVAALKANHSRRLSYDETYNLGATGLRGWIYMDGNNPDSGSHGLITALSRQILVTVAEAPGSAVLAKDDVILGATAVDAGPVPLFSSDCRKALGVEIGEAEAETKVGADAKLYGTLKLKRWRKGVTTDVEISMESMGRASSTTPFACDKTQQVLKKVRTKMVRDLLNDPGFLQMGISGAVQGLALLAAVKPGDPDYSAVQLRLKAFAETIATREPEKVSYYMWDWGYLNIYLCEYYLRTVVDGNADPSLLAGINRNTVILSNAQSKYGTYGHGGCAPGPNGGPNGSVPAYGAINSTAIPANIAITLGEKALLGSAFANNPIIKSAIERGTKFMAYYVNKGSLPYGEHEPWLSGHGSNGKDSMCAVLFGLQGNQPVATEYFSRMSLAGCTGREYGHVSQEFSYLWGILGTLVGGDAAATRYSQNIQWQLDLARRTDGSFTHSGLDEFGGGKTYGNTYLGSTTQPPSLCGLDPTSAYLLDYSVSLKRLNLTGINSNAANTLSTAKVDHAIMASTYKQDSVAYSNTQLITGLGDYDPILRHEAAINLGKRVHSEADLTTLYGMISGTNTNHRLGACEALGLLRPTAAVPLIMSCLSDPNPWVRALAAKALRNYGDKQGTSDGGSILSQVPAMLAAVVTNSVSPDVIAWEDPTQIANGFLSDTLTNSYFANTVIATNPSILYPVVRVCLAQPDSRPRSNFSEFTKNLPTSAVYDLAPDLLAVATTTAQANSMWHAAARARGIEVLTKFKSAEAIPIALAMQYNEPFYSWGSFKLHIAALESLAAFGDLSRWTLPTLRKILTTKPRRADEYPVLVATIAQIEGAITSPTGITNLKAVANSMTVSTTGPVAVRLTSSSCRATPVTMTVVTGPLHGTLSDPAPNLIYTPHPGYSGPDHFTFKAADALTTSEIGTVSIIVGNAGTGLTGHYFDNTDFTGIKFSRTDPQVNYDWANRAPDPALGADTFSVRWIGQLLVPETADYTFSSLSSGGMQVYIDGLCVIDNYTDHKTTWNDSNSIKLTAGQRVNLYIDYYKSTGLAVSKLKWTGPTFAGQNGTIIAKEWLFNGTGMTNVLPSAHTASFTMAMNSEQAITLVGSGPGSNPLSYSIVSQPTHGTLSGVAPNLIYAPNTNYNGPDIFTFLVNDGVNNSSFAQIAIEILGRPLSNYYWTGALTDDWSSPSWSNAAGEAVVPSPTGSPLYRINFDKVGNYTTRQNLNDPFTFNQLNFSGATTITGMNGLTAAANDKTLPQINQYGGSNSSINTPIHLSATTVMGGMGGGSVNLTGPITGIGGLVINRYCETQLLGNSTNPPNSFLGGVTVDDGRLRLGGMNGSRSIHSINPAGSGLISLNNTGTIVFEQVTFDNPLTVNGGMFHSPNGFGFTSTGAMALNELTTCFAEFGAQVFRGNVSGKGGFLKTGRSALCLYGINSYTGTTSIREGSLICGSAASLGTGPLEIYSNSIVELNFTGTRTIAKLSYNGEEGLPPGTYGSITSPATRKSSSLRGSGTITILPPSTTTLTLASGSSPSNVGLPLTFTATVAGSPATGNIAFYDNAILLGTGTLSAAVSSYTTSGLAVGSHQITARYLGNTALAASVSAVVNVEVVATQADGPDNLFAQRGRNSVNLTWTLSSGASSYLIKRSLNVGGPYTTLGSSTQARYTDATANSSIGYSYVVSSISSDKESANSAAASVLSTGLPVTNGLVLRMDASQITGVSDGSQLDVWNDTSGSGNPAIRQQSSSIGYPKYVAGEINALPVVRFDSAKKDAGDYFKFNRISTIRTVFWVLKENAGLSDGHFLLGDSDNNNYQFHREGANGALWSGSNASPRVTNGTTKLMGNLFAATTTALPAAKFQLVSLVTTGDVIANQICQDRVYHGSWQGDIAEILIYDKALTSAEEVSVGEYLAIKYGLATSYPAPTLVSTTQVRSSLNPAKVGLGVTFTAAVPVVHSTGNVNFYSGGTLLGTSRLNGNSEATFSTVALSLGEHQITARYLGDANYLPSVSSALNEVIIQSAYQLWANSSPQAFGGITNSRPTQDPDGDGIVNLMEFVLGGEPMVSRLSILPVLTKTAESWLFEYDRSRLSLPPATLQTVEYGSDLTGWTSLPILASGFGSVMITAGVSSDHVRVTIPASSARCFVRLKVSE